MMGKKYVTLLKNFWGIHSKDIWNTQVLHMLVFYLHLVYLYLFTIAPGTSRNVE